MSLTNNVAMFNVWSGIPYVGDEELYRLAPLCVGQGFRLGMSYSVTDLRTLKNYTE